MCSAKLQAIRKGLRKNQIETMMRTVRGSLLWDGLYEFYQSRQQLNDLAHLLRDRANWRHSFECFARFQQLATDRNRDEYLEVLRTLAQNLVTPTCEEDELINTKLIKVLSFFAEN